MCGRYYINQEMFRELEQILHLVKPDYLSSGDIFPSQRAMILIGQEGALAPHDAWWGIPGKEKQNLILHARAESLRDRPMFRENFARRRCLIPASGFYEWNSQREKAVFSHASHKIIFMAGIYGKYYNRDAFVVITTQANASAAPVHDRMPLIIRPEEISDWISNRPKSEEILNHIPPLLECSIEYEQQTLQF